ncbi:MAG: RNA-binding S4 domain-containing protein [Clostridiales bacterium]|nr:RNA-binding S4 domain-containing protein [Clostridiales bacterium]
MRLDKYLKLSRIIKRRTVAHDAAAGQRVTVNGKTVKPAYDVKPGDVIEIAFGERRLRVSVLATPEHVGKDAAAALYEVLEES